jgi:hypothetical protein
MKSDWMTSRLNGECTNSIIQANEMNTQMHLQPTMQAHQQPTMQAHQIHWDDPFDIEFDPRATERTFPSPIQQPTHSS